MNISKVQASKIFQAKGVARVPTPDQAERNIPGRKYLTDKRRKALENILKKESEREKRNKLQAIITAKLEKKYGRKYNKIISEAVMDYLLKIQTSNISQDDLRELEKFVADRIDSRSKSVDLSQHNSHALNEEPATETYIAPEPPKGKEWQILQAYQAVVSEDKARKEQEENHRKKVQYRKSLDDHLNLRKKIHNDEVSGEAWYHKHVMESVKRFHVEEETKQTLIKNKYLEEKRIRESQIEEQRQQKILEKEALRKQEELIIRQAQDLIEKERLSIAEAKRKERERQTLIAQENLKNLEKREERKQHEATEDFRLMQEYAAKLDREAYERDTAFQRRIANLEAFAKKHTEGAYKKAKESDMKTEENMLREIQLKSELDLINEKNRQESRKMKELQVAKENARLIEIKRQQREQERRNEDKLAQQYQREALAFQQLIDHEKKSRIETQRKYRSILDQHMSIRRDETISKDGMAERERKLNKSDLKRVVEDPNIYSRVLDKIGIATKKPMSR